MFRKILLIFGLFLICFVHATAQGASEKIKVVATIFPNYDFTKKIGKDKVEVVKLLPPGVEAHGFEPRPKDVVAINKADIFVYTGEFMEPWAEDILNGVTNTQLAVVDASKGIELMDEADHGDHGDHHGGEHGFEWAGAFELAAGNYTWSFAKVDGDYADPAMKMVFVSSTQKGVEAIETQEGAAEKMLAMENAAPRAHGEMLSPSGKNAYKLNFDPTKDVTEFPIVIEQAGTYTFFTEHMPFEFEADEHFLKDSKRKDVEPVAQEPDGGDHHHHHHHGGKDPHIWVDLAYAQQMVDTIAQSLIQKDPENKDFYLANAKEYNAKLAELDARYMKTLANCKHNTIIYGGHFAFGYFAKRYNLGHESPYEGFAPNAQPSPKAIAELVDKVEASGIKYVYYEELLDPKVARTVAQETGVELELLHGAHNVSKDELKAGVTYLDIMNENYDKLKVGLECQ